MAEVPEVKNDVTEATAEDEEFGEEILDEIKEERQEVNVLKPLILRSA